MPISSWVEVLSLRAENTNICSNHIRMTIGTRWLLLQWYLRPWAISLMGGVLPFGAIFIETYYVFTAMWAFKV